MNFKSCKIVAIFRCYYMNAMSESLPCKLSDNMPLSWFYSKAMYKTRTFPYWRYAIHEFIKFVFILSKVSSEHAMTQ